MQKGKGARGAVASLATWQRAVGGSTVDRVRRGVHRSTVDRAERGAHTGSGGGRPAAAVRHGRGSELRRDGEPGHGEASRGRWRVAGGTAEPMGARAARIEGRSARSSRWRGSPATRNSGERGRGEREGERARRGYLHARGDLANSGRHSPWRKNDGMEVFRGGRRDLGETELEQGLCDAV